MSEENIGPVFTEEQYTTVVREKNDLQSKLDNLNAQFKTATDNLMSQIEASKQMYNESLNSIYQLRVSNITFQKKIQELTQELEKLKDALSK